MPNTANFGWPTPSGGVPPAVPADMKALADAQDASLFAVAGTPSAPGAPIRFASATARDAAIDPPLKGMACVVDGVLQTYSGSAWEAVNPGWTAYSADFKMSSGTINVGNGVLLTEYRDFGAETEVRFAMSFGSTSSLSGSGYFRFALPTVPSVWLVTGFGNAYSGGGIGIVPFSLGSGVIAFDRTKDDARLASTHYSWGAGSWIAAHIWYRR